MSLLRRFPLLMLLVLLSGGAGLAQKRPAPSAASGVAGVQKQLEAGNVEQAEALARRLLKQEPSSAQAWNLLGVSLVQQKKLDDAQAAFTRSAELDPNALIPRQNLARLYLSRGQNAEAMPLLSQAQNLGTLDSDLGIFFARGLVDSGKKSQAISVLEPIAQRGESVQAMLMLASLEFERGEAARAADVLDKAFNRAPNSEEVLYRYAQSTLASGDPGRSVFVLNAATRMNPHNGEYFYLLGVAWMQLGEMDSAVPSLKQAAELEPDKPLPLIGLGLAMNGQKDYAGAQKALQQALTLDPENTQAMAAMAEALDGSGDSARAQELAESVIKREPRNLKANLVLGNVLMNQNKLQESLAALKRAESVDSKSTKVHYLLSRVYSRLNQPEEAKRHLALYQQAQKDFEEKLRQLRGLPGPGGMKR